MNGWYFSIEFLVFLSRNALQENQLLNLNLYDYIFLSIFQKMDPWLWKKTLIKANWTWNCLRIQEIIFYSHKNIFEQHFWMILKNRKDIEFFFCSFTVCLRFMRNVSMAKIKVLFHFNGMTGLSKLHLLYGKLKRSNILFGYNLISH